MSVMNRMPGWGMAKGMVHTLVRFFQPKVTVQYPEVVQEISLHHRGRLILLYDEVGNLKCETCFQCAMACPIEIIDMGGVDTKNRYSVHWGPAEQYGERREESALRRSGRAVPDRTFAAWLPIDLGPLDRILVEHEYDPRRLLSILEDTQAEYGTPAGGGDPAHQPRNRCLVQRDLRHRDVIPEPGLRARPCRRRSASAAVRRAR